MDTSHKVRGSYIDKFVNGVAEGSIESLCVGDIHVCAALNRLQTKLDQLKNITDMISPDEISHTTKGGIATVKIETGMQAVVQVNKKRFGDCWKDSIIILLDGGTMVTLAPTALQWHLVKVGGGLQCRPQVVYKGNHPKHKQIQYINY